MIRFFRYIRQRLLAENPPDQPSRAGRLGKYLLYAIGEIVLVVIGILIALYLNNLYDNAQDRQRELSYLYRFQNDLELNLKELDRLVNSSDSTLVRIDSLLAVPFGEIPEISNKAFNRLNLAALDYLAFQAAEATVEELIGSGSLDLIEDPEIREAIATWESGLLVIRYLEADNKKAFEDLLEYNRDHAEVYQFFRGRPIFSPEQQRRVLADPVYLNTLAYHAVPLQLLQVEYLNKQAEFKKLLQIVKQEIEEKD